MRYSSPYCVADMCPGLHAISSGHDPENPSVKHLKYRADCNVSADLFTAAGLSARGDTESRLSPTPLSRAREGTVYLTKPV